MIPQKELLLPNEKENLSMKNIEEGDLKQTQFVTGCESLWCWFLYEHMSSVVFMYLAAIPTSGNARLYGNFINFLRKYQMFSTGAIPLYIPTSSGFRIPISPHLC